MNNKLSKWDILKFLYIIASIFFILPSCFYLIKNKTIIDKNGDFNFLLNDEEKLKQVIIYIAIIVVLIVLYLLILKFRKKLFKNIETVLIFIFIVSLIFVFTVPLFSSDVFYYMGIGRINSEYGQNPYYVSIDDYVQNEKTRDLSNDTTLYKGYTNAWAGKTVVYGPIWTMICGIVTKITFGNADICLLMFKLVNLIVHILNCYFIYKISKKKLFVLLYGLNPFIIIESMVNVHNDIFMVFFIILALIKKKRYRTINCISCFGNMYKIFCSIIFTIRYNISF